MKKTLIVTAFILAAVLASVVWSGCTKEEEKSESASEYNSVEYDTSAAIEGTVIDFEVSSPISGAIVNLSPSNRSTITDSAGCFQFTKIESGQYTITVQKTGYQTNRKVITAIAGETVSVALCMDKSN